MAKLCVGLVFGGRSVEHEVSITSATSIFQALDRDRLEIALLGIDRDGVWHLGQAGDNPTQALTRPTVCFPPNAGNRALYPYPQTQAQTSGEKPLAKIDVMFPIVHGSGGEDGSLQGLFELAGIPYVGSGVLGSAIQMDKDIAKRLLAAAGLPVVPWHCVRADDLERKGPTLAQKAIDALGLPLFVKPACLGSSVGISKVERAEALLPALEEAAHYDSKILIEQGVDAREIEVATLGGFSPEASLPGEIRPVASFYDYASKYQNDTTELLIPAPLSPEQRTQVMDLAKCAHCALEAWGMARVDFFLDRKTEQVLLNELNSLPGFTAVSMYPLLWEASGLAYPALLNRLIDLALERSQRQQRLSFRRLADEAAS